MLFLFSPPSQFSQRNHEGFFPRDDPKNESLRGGGVRPIPRLSIEAFELSHKEKKDTLRQTSAKRNKIIYKMDLTFMTVSFRLIKRVSGYKNHERTL